MEKRMRKRQDSDKPICELLFTGTGTSEGTPRVSCLTAHVDKVGRLAQKNEEARYSLNGDGVRDTRDPDVVNAKHPKKKKHVPDYPCMVCMDSVRTNSVNRRRNTGALIRYRYRTPEGKIEAVNIVIDVGKFWWESVMELFPRHGIRRIHAFVITHDHADATFGLDNTRDFTNVEDMHMPVFLSNDCLSKLAKSMPYLVDASNATGSGYVPKLEFHTFEELKPFNVAGLKITPLPVEHGKDYTSFGFLFGRVVYISDVSRVYERTMKVLDELAASEGGVELLVIDALKLNEAHVSHFGHHEAVALARRLRPKQTLLVGMNHSIEHHATNRVLREYLQSDGLDIQLAYDGQSVLLSSL